MTISSAQCRKAQYWVRCCSLSTADLAAIAEKHDVFLHAFADETQLYLYCRRTNTASAAAWLEQCITDVGHWMPANRLKLNTDKTELLWVGSRHSLSQQDGCLPVLQLGSDSIVARDHVRLLGVTLSSDLSFDRHVSIVSAARPVSTGYVNFRNLGVHLTQNLRPHSYIRSSRRVTH